jgi:hypothetical protein
MTQPYLVRTHAILSHLELMEYPPSPSTVSTPQPSRMTLRDRRKQEEVATPVSTKKVVKVKGVIPTTPTRTGGKGDILVDGELLKEAHLSTFAADSGLDEAAKGLENLTIQSASPVTQCKPLVERISPASLLEPGLPPSIPKIMLRIPRPLQATLPKVEGPPKLELVESKDKSVYRESSEDSAEGDFMTAASHASGATGSEGGTEDESSG